MKAPIKALYRPWTVTSAMDVIVPPYAIPQKRKPLKPHFITRVLVDGNTFVPYERYESPSSSTPKSKSSSGRWVVVPPPKPESADMYKPLSSHRHSPKPYGASEGRTSHRPSRNRMPRTGGKKWESDEIKSLKSFYFRIRKANPEVTMREVSEAAIKKRVIVDRSIDSIRGYLKGNLWGCSTPEPESELEPVEPETEQESEDSETDSYNSRSKISGSYWSEAEKKTLVQRSQELLQARCDWGVLEFTAAIAKDLPGRTPEAIRSHMRDRYPALLPKGKRRGRRSYS